MEKNESLCEMNDVLTPTTEKNAITFLGTRVIKVCKYFIKMVKDGECTDEDIAETLALAEPRRFGYIKESDYVGVDEAMRILKLGLNRNLFYSLINQYGIEAQTFKNVKVGYLREDIERLAYTLRQNRPKVLRSKRVRKSKKKDSQE